MRGYRVLATVCLLALAVAGGVGPAAAQTAEQLDWCNGKGGAAPDLRISACTAIIQSGKYSGPSLSTAFTLRADALAAKGEADRAIADYDQALIVTPQNTRALNKRGMARMGQGRYGLALKDFAASIAIDPASSTPWAYQGDALYHEGQPERAIASFAEAIKRAPDWMWPYNDRGELYIDRGDVELALKDFDQVVRVSPTYAMGWNNRCRAHAILGKLDQALIDCNEALKINPRFVNSMLKSGLVSAVQHRAFVHLKAGRWAAAIEDYNKADLLTPKSAEVLYGRGLARLKSGGSIDGAADIAAAKSIRADIADVFKRFGAPSP